MTNFAQIAKEQVKAQGYDLRTVEAKEQVLSLAAAMERKEARKAAAASKKTEVLSSGSCLCGCGRAPRTISALFAQGHDARLKSMILKGQPVNPEGYRYAELNWPGVIVKQGINAPKPKKSK